MWANNVGRVQIPSQDVAESVVAIAAAICKIGTIDIGNLQRVGQAEEERKKRSDEEREERYAARANDFPLQCSTRDYRQLNSCLKKLFASIGIRDRHRNSSIAAGVGNRSQSLTDDACAPYAYNRKCQHDYEQHDGLKSNKN